jgi:hypothetical protein
VTPEQNSSVRFLTVSNRRFKRGQLAQPALVEAYSFGELRRPIRHGRRDEALRTTTRHAPSGANQSGFELNENEEPSHLKQPRKAPVIDLMEALKRSIKAGGRSKSASKRYAGRRRGA